MKAAASLAVERVGERSVLGDVRCEPPFAIRRCGGRFLLVSSAAGPVGGDELALRLTVGARARAEVGSVAAAMAWPGPDGGWSTSRVDVDVGSGAHLAWEPEPLVSVRGSRHGITTRVRLAADATCRLVEEVVLGRHGEPSGELLTSLRVDRDGRPLLHHDEHLGPQVAGAGSVVTVGDFRHVLIVVVVGPPAGAPRTRFADSARGAWLPLDDDAAVSVVVGADRPAARALSDELRPGCGERGADAHAHGAP